MRSVRIFLKTKVKTLLYVIIHAINSSLNFFPVKPTPLSK